MLGRNGIDAAAGFLLQMLRRAAKWRNQLSRLRVDVSSEETTNRTIYFLTPDHSQPAGGIRVIYRHVDILNQLGIRAFVLHQNSGFRCNWFENSTSIVYRGSTKVFRGDILVLPEICLDVLDRLSGATDYAIFNQGVHLSWKPACKNLSKHYKPGNGLRGVATVSLHSQKMLRFAFGCDPFRIHVGIDSSVFHPNGGPRSNRLSYMPRRMPQDARLVLDILRSRGALDGWDVVALDDMNQSDVAAELRKSKIFLSFGYQEGFGFPPAEAMACGNYVLGYHGFGGQEYFRPEFSVPIATGDAMSFAQAVEAAIQKENLQPGWCEERGSLASSFVLDQYSLDREFVEVRQFYEGMIEKGQTCVERNIAPQLDVLSLV